MNGAQALVEELLAYETQVVFGLPGDTSIDLYDALRATGGRIKHIVARDERSAAFMADVYARLTGKPGICEGPSGGGATYMLPGIVEANGSSVALIALTTDNPIDYEAQGALTDLNQPAIFSSVTKWATRVPRAGMLPRFLRRAFRLATSGRPGAVHLALPKDVLGQDVPDGTAIYAEEACRVWPSYRSRPAAADVERLAHALLAAERPVIVAGGGLVSSGAFAELLAVAEQLNAPVGTTINGKGAIAETHRLSLGVIGGNGGRPYANQVVQEADLVLYVGSKVSYVDSDNWRVPQLAKPPVVLQIDVDASELGNNYPLSDGLCADARLALADLHVALRDLRPAPAVREPWLSHIARRKSVWRSSVDLLAASADQPIMPQRLVAELHKALPAAAVLVSDPGTSTPFLAAEYELGQPGRAISPRAQGGLGYAIPGVVGARLAKPGLPVVGLCGDGSFAMSASDLVTVARAGGPTVLILFNNRCYGWIKALQKFQRGGRYFSVDLDEPLDYVEIAQGFGLPGRKITDPADFSPALRQALDSGRPSFLEVATAPEHDAMPPVAAWQRAAASQTQLDE